MRPKRLLNNSVVINIIVFLVRPGRVKRKNLKKATEKKEKPEGEEEEDTWALIGIDVIASTHSPSWLSKREFFMFCPKCYFGWKIIK